MRAGDVTGTPLLDRPMVIGQVPALVGPDAGEAGPDRPGHRQLRLLGDDAGHAPDLRRRPVGRQRVGAGGQERSPEWLPAGGWYTGEPVDAPPHDDESPDSQPVFELLAGEVDTRLWAGDEALLLLGEGGQLDD